MYGACTADVPEDAVRTPYKCRTDTVRTPYGRTGDVRRGYRTDISYNWLKHIPILLPGPPRRLLIWLLNPTRQRAHWQGCAYLLLLPISCGYRNRYRTDIVQIPQRTSYRISYGRTADVRRMYGGCTAKYRTDIVQAPYGYRTDITEPLPLQRHGGSSEMAGPSSEAQKGIAN